MTSPYEVWGAASADAHATTTYPSIIALNTDGSVYVEELTPTAESCSPILGPEIFRRPRFSRAGYPIGNVANLAADIDDDGMTDLVAWSSQSIWVSFGQPSADGSELFGPPLEVSTLPFSGGVTNLVADLNGDHILDLVAWSASSVSVEWGSASRTFSTPQPFSSVPFYGTTANVVADVNGDGKYDLVAWSPNARYEMLSQGFFGDSSVSQDYFVGAFYGNVANLSGALPRSPANTGPVQIPDQLLAWNTTSTYALCLESCTPSEWNSVPFYGSRANLVLDVNLDGKNDIVAVDDAQTYVELTNVDYGRILSLPKLWCSEGAFYGSVATLGGYTVR